MDTQQKMPAGLSNLNALAKIMDAQFRIPGTDIRFGIDALVGLIPGVGDVVTFLISSYMVSTAAKQGVSNYVLVRMILNIILDGLVGAIPILGDVFDVVFKANQRNMKLLQEHYAEGKHRGSAKKIIIPVVIVFIALLMGLTWLVYRIIASAF